MVVLSPKEKKEFEYWLKTEIEKIADDGIDQEILVGYITSLVNRDLPQQSLEAMLSDFLDDNTTEFVAKMVKVLETKEFGSKPQEKKPPAPPPPPPKPVQLDEPESEKGDLPKMKQSKPRYIILVFGIESNSSTVYSLYKAFKDCGRILAIEMRSDISAGLVEFANLEAAVKAVSHKKPIMGNSLITVQLGQDYNELDIEKAKIAIDEEDIKSSIDGFCKANPDFDGRELAQQMAEEYILLRKEIIDDEIDEAERLQKKNEAKKLYEELKKFKTADQ